VPARIEMMSVGVADHLKRPQRRRRQRHHRQTAAYVLRAPRIKFAPQVFGEETIEARRDRRRHFQIIARIRTEINRAEYHAIRHRELHERVRIDQGIVDHITESVIAQAHSFDPRPRIEYRDLVQRLHAAIPVVRSELSVAIE